MIESVPLIQDANDAQQINASIIAMKKASKELDEKILKLNNLNKELDKKIAVLDNGLAQEITDRENADNAEVTNRNTAITNAVNALDVASVGGSGKYISAISETNGKISATVGDLTSVIESGNNQPATSGGVAEAIDNIQYLRYGADVIGGDQVDNLPDVFCVKKVRNYDIGWAGNDGFIIHIPWSSLYAKQIAFDEQTNFMAVRIKNNGTWESWTTVYDTLDDTVTQEITSQMNLSLGVAYVGARRKQRNVYLYFMGQYTGIQTIGTQTLATNLPEKYRPSQVVEGLALLGYNNTQATSVGRVLIYPDGNIVLGETSWETGTQIRGGVIYFI